MISPVLQCSVWVSDYGRPRLDPLATHFVFLSTVRPYRLYS